MSEDLHSLVQNLNKFKFRLLHRGEPVNRAEIEDMSTRPKPIIQGGDARRKWTAEPVEPTTDPSKPVVATLRADGALVVAGEDGLLWALIEECPPGDPASKWVIAPFTDVNGSTSLGISQADTPLMWTLGLPGDERKQVVLAESFVPGPNNAFTLTPIFE